MTKLNNVTEVVKAKKVSHIVIEDHFEGKTTIVYQINGVKCIHNGCQDFAAEKRHRRFVFFNVEKNYRQDVEEALKKIDTDVDLKTFEFLLEKGVSLKSPTIDWDVRLNQEQTKILLRRQPENIWWVNKKYIDEELSLEILEKNPKFTAHLPEEHVSFEQYKAAIINNPYFLTMEGFEKYKTKELIIDLLKTNLLSVYAVPRKLMCQEIANWIVNQVGILDYIPKEFVTEEMIEKLKGSTK